MRSDHQKLFQAVPRGLTAFAPNSDNVVTTPAPNRPAAKLSGLFAGATRCHADPSEGAVGRRLVRPTALAVMDNCRSQR
jgi:hypothetical protein